MLTKESIHAMKEDELRTVVLIPLLRAMGFQDVFEHHGGAGEQGKDIVCWKTDELGVRENYALVVKAKPVSGQAQPAKGTAGEVSIQISQSFGKPFLDPITAEERVVHRCWVVSNQDITKEAGEAIKSTLATTNLNRLIRFIDGDLLWELVEQHLPVQAVWQKLAEAARVFENVDSHYRLQAKVSGPNLEVSVGEKFPGASSQKPFTIHAAFAFPSTPEGQQVREAFEHHLATGAPVDIPAQYIQKFEMPEFVQQILGPGDPQSQHVHLVSYLTQGETVSPKMRLGLTQDETGVFTEDETGLTRRFMLSRRY